MQGILVSLKMLQMMGRKKGALGFRNTLLHSQGKPQVAVKASNVWKVISVRYAKANSEFVVRALGLNFVIHLLLIKR